MTTETVPLKDSFAKLAPASVPIALKFFDRLLAGYPEFHAYVQRNNVPDLAVQLGQTLQMAARAETDPDRVEVYLAKLADTLTPIGIPVEGWKAGLRVFVETLDRSELPNWTDADTNLWWDLLADALYTMGLLPHAETSPYEPAGEPVTPEQTQLTGSLDLDDIIPAAAPVDDARGVTLSEAELKQIGNAFGSPVPSLPAVESSATESEPAVSSHDLDHHDQYAGNSSASLPEHEPMPITEISAETNASTSTGPSLSDTLLDQDRTAKLFIEPDGTVRRINRAARRLLTRFGRDLGIAEANLTGSPISRLYDGIDGLRDAIETAAQDRPQTITIDCGEETLEIATSVLTGDAGERLGLMQEWAIVTDRQQQARTLREANENVEAINRITKAVSEAADLDAAIRVALDTVRDAFGWAYGSYWRRDPQKNELVFGLDSGTVTPEFHQATATASFPEGTGLSGRTWRNRDLVFVDDLATVKDCCRAPAAQRAGVKSGVCFPIMENGNVEGTMDFFATEKLTLSDDRLETLRNVGRIVSEAIEMKAHINETARLQSMMDAMPINVLMSNRQFDLIYMNPASRKTLKSIEHLLPRPVDELVGQKIDIFHKNPEHQRRMLADPSNLPHRAKISLGEETLDLTVSPVLDSDKNYTGMMVTWAVVTAQVNLADSFEKNVKGVVGAVTGSANQMREESRSLAAATEETSRQSQAVAAASEEATRNVQTVSAAADELSKSITEIAQHVQEASQMTSRAVDDAQRTNVTIQKLGESSNEIGQVIKVITSIAQQTNLLALNATIEAARAGEAGKGFAVVANEVKELARQTAKATEEISQKIEAIQSSTSVAVSSIGSIGESIGKIHEISTTIASAVEQQSAATSEISRNVSEAARGNQEVSSNISGVSQAAEESGQGVNNILTAAESLAEESSRLDRVADDFLVEIRAL